jgi:hypothetical protein
LRQPFGAKKYEPNGKKVGPRFTKAKDGSYQFFISWAHDKLDFKPGMKTIKAADLNGPDSHRHQCIELVKADYFKPQMECAECFPCGCPEGWEGYKCR